MTAPHNNAAPGLIEFAAQPGEIDGMYVVQVKSITDERGTIREIFRRSAFAAVGIDLAAFAQINVTGSRHGVVRGMHAESMTKLVTLASGAALGMYVDFRPDSPTRGTVASVELRPGVQVLVPAGVGNGFQALTDGCEYVYCFDQEWTPTMAGQACSPCDPAFVWPIPIDRNNRAQVSLKDADAPMLADIMATAAPSSTEHEHDQHLDTGS